MTTPLRVLILEDEPVDAELFVHELHRAGFEPEWQRVDTEAGYLAQLDPALDVILANYHLPQFDALRALQHLKERELDVPLIVVTVASEEAAVECMKQGAADYLVKDRLARLGPAVTQALEHTVLRRALPRREADLRQAQKMEAIGRLAGGIAHDFNNLLTIIQGRCALLLDRFPPGDPALRHVKLMQKTAERAATLTRQLLAFSRKQVLQPKVLDLNAVVAGMEKMLRRLIGEDIELLIVPGPQLGSIATDPGQIEQVILNLAVNAADAMPQGGRLTIETANVELDESYVRQHPGSRKGSHAMVAVTDSGVGMTAETQAHLFEPFFTTKGPDKGTGLGLATVYGIVKQSGGYITAYSVPGYGSTFKVYLPRANAPAEPAGEVQRGGAPLGGSETILLVDDEDDLRDMVREVLEIHGYQVLEARGPEGALEIGAGHRQPIHLLVSDVVMPKMGGTELAQRLAQVRPEMQVLYMSGYTDSAVVQSGMLNGATAFIQKPFTPEALAQKVREVLDLAGRSDRSGSAPVTKEPWPHRSAS